MSSHYSCAFHSSFNSRAREVAKKIVDMFEEIGKGYPVLCYTGFSGITLATLIAQHIRMLGMRVEHIYVRKEGEKSHGGVYYEFSCRNLGSQAVPLFVDDFISTGDTHEHVRKNLIKFHAETERDLPGYDCWNGFFFLTDMKPIVVNNGTIYYAMPRVLMGMEESIVALESHFWTDDVPFPENASLTMDAA
jgi:hypothetical protein